MFMAYSLNLLLYERMYKYNMHVSDRFGVAVRIDSEIRHAFFPDIQRRMRHPELFPLCFSARIFSVRSGMRFESSCLTLEMS